MQSQQAQAADHIWSPSLPLGEAALGSGLYNASIASCGPTSAAGTSSPLTQVGKEMLGEQCGPRLITGPDGYRQLRVLRQGGIAERLQAPFMKELSGHRAGLLLDEGI